MELSEDSLSLNELAETPLDSFALPSGIFALYDLHGSYGPSEVVDLRRFEVGGGEKNNTAAGQGSKGTGDRLVISESRAVCMSRLSNVTRRFQL